jgi:adenosylcobinamide-GDP ribazoletransferase
LLAALLAIAAIVLLTGGLHEDALADTADGFGGGHTAEQKLAIMDDSRIGAFGALALAFSILFRVAALSALAEAGAFAAAVALIAAEAASRAAMVRLWHGLPAARAGSLSESGGSPDDRAMLVALAAAAVIVIVTVVPTFGIVAAVAATIVLGLAAYGFTRLCARQIGGRTGDTLGACQQISVIAFLVALAPFA